MTDPDTFYKFRFDILAGTVERRVFMDQLSTWLFETVGHGFFSISDSDDAIESNTQWVIVLFHNHIKVLLRNSTDATIFALKWT